MIIYRNGTQIADVKPLDSSYVKRAVMAENSLQFDFYSTTAITILRGDYCTAAGTQWIVSETPLPELIKGCYKYSVKFLSTREELDKCILRQFGSSEVVYTCTPLEFLQLVVDCMQALQPTKGWSVGTCISDDAKTVSFSNQTCLQALQNASSENMWNTEFWTDGYTINLCRQEFTPATMKSFSVQNGLKSIVPERNASTNFYTRIYAQGGTKNLPSTYAYKRLQMDVPYLQDPDASVIIEHEEIYDDIFPHREGAISEVKVQNGFYFFKDASLPYNPNDLQIDGLTKHVSFTSGPLIGLDFEVNYDAGTGFFEIITYSDQAGFSWPSAEAMPEMNNTYVLYNIQAPEAHINSAMAEVKARAQAALDSHKKEPISLNLTTDDGSFFKNGTTLTLGEMVIVEHDQIPALVGGRNIRITEFKRSLNTDYKYDSLKVSDLVYSNPVSSVQDKVEKVEKVLHQTGISAPLYHSRNWGDMVELSNMIKTLQASMLIIGEVQGAYTLKDIRFITNYQSNINMFNSTAGTLVHKTIPTELNPGTWSIPSFTTTLPDQGKAYYLYAKCSRNDSSGVLLFSEVEIPYDSDALYFHFLIGTISSVLSGFRVFSTIKGYTQITGDSIRTGILISADGVTYFNLNTGEIGGKIKLTSGSSGLENFTEWAEKQGLIESVGQTAQEAKDYIDNVLPLDLSSLQSQIDGQIESWFKEYDPTTDNLPASQWNTDSIKQQHGNDTFTNTLTGGCWRWQQVSGVWQWGVISDTATQQALTAAARAQDTADGKRRVFTIQPTTDKAYDVGDLWSNATFGTLYSNDLLRCKTSKAVGVAFSIDHWEKASKYTDDTAVNNLQIGGRNLLSSPVFSVYNNNGDVATLTDLSETYYLQKVRQLRFTPDGSANANIIATDYGGHGIVISPAKAFLANTKYIASIYWKCLNYQDVTISITPSNVGGWTDLETKTIGDGWYRSTAARDGSVSENKTDNIYVGFKCPSAEDGTEIVLNFVCPQLEIGNRVSDWTEAPEDSEAKIAYIEAKANQSKAITDKLGTTIDGALVETVLMLLRGLNSETETAGISGIQGDGTLPAAFFGGTYAEAISGIAKTIFRHDGSAQLAGGNLWWDVLGRLFFGKSGNGESIKISTEAIPTLEEINNREVYTLPIIDAQVVKDLNNPSQSEIDVNSTILQEFTLEQSGLLTVDSYVSYQAGSDIVGFGCDGFIYIEKYNGSTWDVLYQGETDSLSVYLTIYQQSVTKGRYRLRSAVSCGYTSVEGPNATIVLYKYSEIRYQLNVKNLVVGIDGIALFDSMSNNMFRLALSAVDYILSVTGGLKWYSPDKQKYLEITDNGVKINGSSDIPGGLGGASINSAGAIGSYWGKMLLSGNGVSKNGNVYTITHYIGDTNYSIFMSPISANMPYYTSKTANTIIVTCAGGFDFILIRTK